MEDKGSDSAKVLGHYRGSSWGLRAGPVSAGHWATHPSGTTLGPGTWAGWAWRGLQQGSMQGGRDWSCCGLAGAGADGPGD